GGEVRPQLHAPHLPLAVSLRHLLVDDAAPRRHPLDLAGPDDALVAEAVPVLDVAVEDVGDGLDAPVRVPGEPLPVVVGVLGSEVVEQQERVELRNRVEAERASQVDARPLEGRLALPDLLYGAEHVGRRHRWPPPRLSSQTGRGGIALTPGRPRREVTATRN